MSVLVTALRIGLPLVVVAISGIAAFYITTGRPEAKAPPEAEEVAGVEAISVKAARHEASLVYFGEVSAGRSIDIRTRVAGEIMTVHPQLRAGGHIRAGETVVEIDRFDYQGGVIEAKANLAEGRANIAETESQIATAGKDIALAEAELAQAGRDLARASELRRSGSTTEKQLETQQLGHERAQTALQGKKSALDLLQLQKEKRAATLARLEWRLEKAEKDLASTVIVAPFDAVVQSENVEPGRFAGAGEVLASLTGAAGLEVRFTIPDLDFSEEFVSGEAPVSVTWENVDGMNVFPAKILRKGGSIGSDRTGITVFAEIGGEGAEQLLPGSFVKIAMAGRSHTDSFRIPASAIYNYDTVYRINGESRLERRKVKILGSDGDWRIVRAELEDGDMLLASRLARAGDGVKVKTVDSLPGENSHE